MDEVTAADLKQAIGDAQDDTQGISFDPIASNANPVTLTSTSSTFLNVLLNDQWRIDSLSTSGTLTVGEGNVVNVNNGIDIFVPNALVSFVNNTSSAGVLVQGTGSGLDAGQDAKLTAIDTKTTYHDQIINNFKELIKISTVWNLVIYGDGEVSGGTEILRKAMKDKDGNNITDLAAGVLASELENTV